MAKVGLLLAVPVTAALGVTIVQLAQREPDTRFEAEAKSPVPLRADIVANAVKTVPRTRTGPAGTSATCTTKGSGQLRNPWHCTVRYPGAASRAFVVKVAANQHYVAEAVDGQATIDGCCVRFVQ
jgi:hypothetical protein